MTRGGGAMADAGSVAYMFSRRGVVIVPQDQGSTTVTEDDVLLSVLEAGADEINDIGDAFEVLCDPTDLVAVRTALQAAGLDYDSAEASFVPSLTVPVDAEGAAKVLRLIDALEDSDDVQNVFANFDASDEVLAQLT
jgi:transcriptional/translational regulatory protein YebC/TACO1